MNVPVPPEFETFARAQVAAGRHDLVNRKALLALLDPTIEQLDRGEGQPFNVADTKRGGREQRQRTIACPD